MSMKMSEEIKLKPCPFCGGEAKPVFRGSCNYVVCSNEEECWCGMTCPVTTPEEAARIWNRRANAKELVVMFSVSDEQVRRMVDEAVSAAIDDCMEQIRKAVGE